MRSLLGAQSYGPFAVFITFYREGPIFFFSAPTLRGACYESYAFFNSIAYL